MTTGPMQRGTAAVMERQEYQDLLHLTDDERSALAERLRLTSRNSSGPRGERRREKRWDFFQPNIAVCVEHPGGGISKFLVWARDISAGGMAFLHGGFLHVGSHCKIAPTALDGHRVVVNGTITGCRLVEGRLHSISVKFEQRIDASLFLADYVEPAPSPVVPANQAATEPIYTSLSGKEGDAEHVNKYIAEVNVAAKTLVDSITSSDLNVVKDVCTKIKGSAKGSGFESLGAIAGEAQSLLEAGKSIADATAQLQQLRQLCERVAARPKEDGEKKGHPPEKKH